MLGKGGGVQSVEDDPESDSARATLVESVGKNQKDLQTDSDLKQRVLVRLDLRQARGLPPTEARIVPSSRRE